MGLNLKTSGISRTFGVFEERTREIEIEITTKAEAHT
jgi:hypothetical protein